jgi:hypothetical protein
MAKRTKKAGIVGKYGTRQDHKLIILHVLNSANLIKLQCYLISVAL